MPTRLLPLVALHALLLFQAIRAQGAPLAGELQLVGEWTAHVERVRAAGQGEVTLTLLGLPSTVAIDRGDRLRVEDPGDGSTVTGAVVARDSRDAAASGRVHVRVRLDRPEAAPWIAARTPEHDRELPAPGPEHDAFVRARAPRAVLTAPFEPAEGDRLADFVRVEDTASGARVDPGAVPTQCRIVLQFSEPVDPATLGIDFLQLRQRREAGAAVHLVPTRLFALDEAGTRFAVGTPFGLPFFKAEAADAEAQRMPHFALCLVPGPNGIRARSGRAMSANVALELPITIDPDEPENRVAWRAFVQPAGR